MRPIALFIMAYLYFSLNVFAESFGEQYNNVKDQLKAGAYSTKLLKEQRLKDESPCTHCPRFLDLTSQVNKIVAKLKTQPDIAKNSVIPSEVNRLKFLYYVVRARVDDGTIKCNRYMDYTPDLRPTSLEGELQLMAQDVFKFDGISHLQVMRPETDEVTYYYRGEGIESNILIQASLTKEGGKLRYYHYEPTTNENNPYNLPDLGGPAAPRETYSLLQKITDVVDPSMTPSSEASPVSPAANSGTRPLNPSDTSASLKFKPKLKNLQIAEGDMSHSINDDGLKLKAKSNLSLKGNAAVIDLSNKEGNIVVINLNTKIDGKTQHSIQVPYHINVAEKNKVKIEGYLLDDSHYRQLTMSLTDKEGPYFRSEYYHNKDLKTERMSVSRDIAMSAKETVGISFGRDESKSKYVSVSHKKTVTENITVVMDVRVNHDRQMTFMYQLNAKF